MLAKIEALFSQLFPKTFSQLRVKFLIHIVARGIGRCLYRFSHSGHVAPDRGVLLPPFSGHSVRDE